MKLNLSKLVKDPIIFPSLVGLVSFGAGAGIGYLIGHRKRTVEWNAVVHDGPIEQTWTLADLATVPEDELEETEESIAEGEAFVQARLKESLEDIVTPEEVEEIEEANRVPKAIKQSVFNEGDDVWDYEAEIAKRNGKDPYILHKDEFYADERSYSQGTLTYYAGDDILCDEEDKPIYNYAAIIGPMTFGHGSGDQNVFYVRNDKLKAEYEIIKDKGLFSVEVLGLEIEENARTADLQHSGNRKFRQQD